jgi:uncharacterized protein (DUF302 family)
MIHDDRRTGETHMIQILNVEHHEHVSKRSFEDVMHAFYDVTGSIEEGFGEVAKTAHSPEEFERVFKAREGSSGFMRFDVIDHGGWLATIGQKAKAVMVVLGNPLIARTMLQHDVGAGLNVPVRIFIYQHQDGKTRVAYDLPSTLMSNLKGDPVAEAASKLDAKLVALAERISGVKADAKACSD